MHFDIFTLIPGMFQGPFTESILKRAQERGLLSIALHNIRDATTDKHHVVDDYPYGGGAGMVMKPEPIFASIEALYQGGPIILLTPQGRLFNQQIARWRRKESLRLTRKGRPDLFARLDLSSKLDMQLLKELEEEE